VQCEWKSNCQPRCDRYGNPGIFDHYLGLALQNLVQRSNEQRCASSRFDLLPCRNALFK
jgi:hypothetical protein